MHGIESIFSRFPNIIRGAHVRLAFQRSGNVGFLTKLRQDFRIQKGSSPVRSYFRNVALGFSMKSLTVQVLFEISGLPKTSSTGNSGTIITLAKLD